VLWELLEKWVRNGIECRAFLFGISKAHWLYESVLCLRPAKQRKPAALQSDAPRALGASHTLFFFFCYHSIEQCLQGRDHFQYRLRATTSLSIVCVSSACALLPSGRDVATSRQTAKHEICLLFVLLTKCRALLALPQSIKSYTYLPLIYQRQLRLLHSNFVTDA
jgi:hypothetical protein